METRIHTHKHKLQDLFKFLTITACLFVCLMATPVQTRADTYYKTDVSIWVQSAWLSQQISGKEIKTNQMPYSGTSERLKFRSGTFDSGSVAVTFSLKTVLQTGMKISIKGLGIYPEYDDQVLQNSAISDSANFKIIKQGADDDGLISETIVEYIGESSEEIKNVTFRLTYQYDFSATQNNPAYLVISYEDFEVKATYPNGLSPEVQEKLDKMENAVNSASDKINNGLDELDTELRIDFNQPTTSDLDEYGIVGIIWQLFNHSLPLQILLLGLSYGAIKVLLNGT